MLPKDLHCCVVGAPYSLRNEAQRDHVLACPHDVRKAAAGTQVSFFFVLNWGLNSGLYLEPLHQWLFFFLKGFLK
jgi:hypothetical protein